MREIATKKKQIAAVILSGFVIWVWWGILIASLGEKEDAVYFLDVGQGDSELIILSSRNGNDIVKILIDGGRNKRVLNALEAVLPRSEEKYIDVVMLTHPDLDHFGGLVEVLKFYDVGIFISNGLGADIVAFSVLQEEIKRRGVKTLILAEGDVIRYGPHVISILSPDAALLIGKSTNEASIVALLESPSRTSEVSDDRVRVLFTGDIGFVAEENLLAKEYNLKADILKVGHHGSKNSSGENFIAAVRPFVAGIGVGDNKYGHPSPRVLETLELAGARVYTTQHDGTIKIALHKDFALPDGNKDIFREEGFVATVLKIFTQNYKRDGILALSLPRIKKEHKNKSKLVSYANCSFESNENLTPARFPILLNEIAWMGGGGGSTHEWIEFQNVSGRSVNMSGWQVINENGKMHFTFPQQTIFEDQFLVIARNAANDALGLDTKFIFSGAIRNENESLRLFDNNCRPIDEVLASSSWPAGDNKTKQTMERTKNLLWVDSQSALGTPGRSNSAEH